MLPTRARELAEWVRTYIKDHGPSTLFRMSSASGVLRTDLATAMTADGGFVWTPSGAWDLRNSPQVPPVADPWELVSGVPPSLASGGPWECTDRLAAGNGWIYRTRFCDYSGSIAMSCLFIKN